MYTTTTTTSSSSSTNYYYCYLDLIVLGAGSARLHFARVPRVRFARVPRVLFCAGSARVVLRGFRAFRSSNTAATATNT